MNLIFSTINKPFANTDIQKLLYNGTEDAFKKSFKENLNKVKDKLEGLDINIEIDFKNSTARFYGEDISDEQMEVIKEALNENMK